MRLNKKMFLGMGSILVPVSILTVAVSCTDGTKPINTELQKVKLNFPNATNTLASSLNKDSNFNPTGFDASKYELEIVNVSVPSGNNTSVEVTIKLKEKTTSTTKEESTTRVITLTGFKAPETAKPGETIGGAPGTETGGTTVDKQTKPSGSETAKPGGTTIDKQTKPSSPETTKPGKTTVDKQAKPAESGTTKPSGSEKAKPGGPEAAKPSESKPTKPGEPTPGKGSPTITPAPTQPKENKKVTEAKNKLNTFLTQKISSLDPETILHFSGNVKSKLTEIQKFSSPNSSLEFDASKLSVKIGNDEILKFQIRFFDSVKKGIEYLLRHNGGSIKDLSDVLESKVGSITKLTSSQPVTRVVSFLSDFGTFQSNWKEDLNKGLQRKDFDFKIDFGNNTVSIKTDENVYSELVKFNKDFVDGIKDTLKTIATNLVNKALEADKKMESTETSTTLTTLVNSIVNSAFSSLWNGTWNIKRAANGKVEFDHNSAVQKAVVTINK